MFFDFKQKRNIVLLIFLIVLVLSGLFFLFSLSHNKENDFLKYVPANSVFYIEFSLNSVNKSCLFDKVCLKKTNFDLFEKWLRQNPNRRRILLNITRQIRKSFPKDIDFEKEILPLLSDKILLVGLRNGNELELGFVASVRSREQVSVFLDKLNASLDQKKVSEYQGYKITEINPKVKNLSKLVYSFLDKENVVIACDLKVIEDLIDTRRGLSPSLLDQTKKQSKSTKRKIFGQRNIFLSGQFNPTALRNYSLQPQNLSEISYILSFLLNHCNDLDRVNFWGQIFEDKLILTLQSEEDSWPWQFSRNEKNFRDVLLNLGNSGSEIKFAFLGKNLRRTFIEILRELDSNPSMSSYFKKAQATNEEIYHFSFEKDIFPFFAGNSFFLVFNRESRNGKIRDQFFRDIWEQFVSFFSIKNIPRQAEYALVIDKVSDSLLLKLEDIIKQILAFELPQEQEKILPDQTKVIELVADPSQFSFKEEWNMDKKIRFIKQPSLNFEFGYSVLDNKVIFSNSVELIKKLQTKYPIMKGLKFREETKMFYFSFDDFFRKNYGLTEVVANDQSDKNRLLIKFFVY